MAVRTNTRRYLLMLVAAVALVGSGLGVAALAQPDDGDVFTGCLNENSGVLRNVAVGFEPAKTCNPQEVQITWDRAGPAFEGRIAALEERVAELEETFGTLELFAAAVVDVTDVAAGTLLVRLAVGPIEAVTYMGQGHYRLDFGEDGFDLRNGAVISLATNSPIQGTYCTYSPEGDNLDIHCWNGAEGGNQPEDAEWSLMVFKPNTVPPTP